MDNVISIREAVEADYPAICKLINNELGYPDVTTEALSDRMKKMQRAGNYQTFVAVMRGVVVGFIGIAQELGYEISGEYLRIIALAVSSEHQNKGIGSKILRHVESIAHQNGVSYFTLSSSMYRTAAHAFYERNGYMKKSYSFSKGLKNKWKD